MANLANQTRPYGPGTNVPVQVLNFPASQPITGTVIVTPNPLPVTGVVAAFNPATFVETNFFVVGATGTFNPDAAWGAVRGSTIYAIEMEVVQRAGAPETAIQLVWGGVGSPVLAIVTALAANATVDALAWTTSSALGILQSTTIGTATHPAKDEIQRFVLSFPNGLKPYAAGAFLAFGYTIGAAAAPNCAVRTFVWCA